MPTVYILTNECMPDTIKIGFTEDLERRIKDLDNTSVALPFECFYAVQVDDARAIERLIHQGLDEYRVRPNREFFQCAPEKAKSILKITETMGAADVTPTEDIVATPQDRQALENAKQRRRPFNFLILNIQPGTILHFLKDDTITCEVIDDKRVKFRNEITSLSASANIVIEEMGYDWGGQIQGPAFWCVNGEPLSVLRRKAGHE